MDLQHFGRKMRQVSGRNHRTLDMVLLINILRGTLKKNRTTITAARFFQYNINNYRACGP